MQALYYKNMVIYRQGQKIATGMAWARHKSKSLEQAWVGDRRTYPRGLTEGVIQVKEQ